MMAGIYKYTAVFLIAFALGLIAMYAVVSGRLDPGPRTLDPGGIVSTHTVTLTAPIQALDKKQLMDRGNRVPVKSEVLATGNVKDSDGTKHIAAVLDTTTGNTKLMETRPLMESMQRYELGIGAGLESGDFSKVVQVRYTMGRFSSLYLTGQAEFFFVDRIENRHPWNTMAFLNWRF